MSRSSVARALTSALLLILPAMLAGSVTLPAHAQPANSADLPGGEEVTMGWPTLGLEPGIVLSPDAPTGVTVPVPAGLSAERLRGTIRLPLNIGAGYVEIDDGDGKFLAVVDLPRPASAGAVTPFDVDISAAHIRSSVIDLSFIVRPLDTADQFCGPLQQVALGDLATTFTGTEQPTTTIANFFPSVLERVTLYPPTDADAAEQQAVLTLVSTLTRLYQPQPLEINVVSQPRGATPPPSPPLARAIVVEAGDFGLTVQNPGNPDVYLRVSGRGDEITTQVALLVNELQTLAQAAEFRVDQAGSDAPLSGDTLTFSQLKISGKTTVLRASSLSAGIDRSALGAGRVDSVQVHLLANYTPVPKDDAATVLIRSNGLVVYRAMLDDTGLLDATFNLERQAFGQYIRLDFALTYTPRACGPLTAPIIFEIDPRSTLTMHRGGPPLGGFGAVPSEFSPSFMVAFDGSGPDQLAYAARAVAEIARLTGRQLTPQVVDLKAAVDGTSGALIVADSAAISETSLNPPLGGNGTALDIGLPTELRADIGGELGSIQAFADRPRNRSVVLVTTTAAWTLVDPLFNYIDGLDGRWSALTGDVLAVGAAGVPTNIAIRADGSAAESLEPQPSPHSMNQWIPVGIGATVVAAIAIGAAALWSRRRRTAGIGGPDDAPVTKPGRNV